MKPLHRRTKRLGLLSASLGILLFLCVKSLVFYRYIFTHHNYTGHRPKETSLHSKDVVDNGDDAVPTCSLICPFGIPCLRKLTPKSKTNEAAFDRGGLNLNSQLQSKSIQEIHRIPGTLDPVHYHIVPVISAIQWRNGIYGSVAEFGVGVGKFTSLLAQNIDAEAGERLFVADSFSQPLDGQLSMRGRLTQYDLFAANLRRLGFDEGAVGPKRMLVHRGTTEDFRFERLKEWQLPLFRLISVNARGTNATLAPVLDLAACLLTDGGILVVEDLKEGDRMRQRVAPFHGKPERESELSLILVAGDKLFFANSQWSQLLFNSIKEAAESLHLRVFEAQYSGSNVLRIVY